MVIECALEEPHVAVAVDAAEALLALERRGGGPAQRHLAAAPALHVALNLADAGAQRVDRVARVEGLDQRRREREPRDGQRLLEALADARGGPGVGLLQRIGQTPECALRLVGILLPPGLIEPAADERPRALREMLEGVAGLVQAVTLDQRETAVAVADSFADPLAAVDDEEQRAVRLQAALGEVGKERLADDGVLRRPLPEGPGCALRPWRRRRGRR